MKKRILFVDDEPMVLRGIRRMFSDMRGEWDMAFAEGGKEALADMEEHPADVIVSDIKMPEMDGVELMGRVKDKYPDTVRVAMTGQSSASVAILSAVTVHRYISKPCNDAELKEIILKSLNTQRLVDDEALRTMISKVHILPSVPDIYKELNEELAKEDTSLNKVARIIGRDVSMCAKILQLVNSSFFGFARHIESPEQAVTLLGINIIKSLVLSMHLFGEFAVDKTPGFTLEYLWHHSLRVSQFSKGVAKDAGYPKEDIDHAFIAGILHDVGKLVLAANLPDQFNAVLGKVRSGGLLMWEAEKEIFGHTHAEVGAYLMGMWGLPDQVVDAIAYHHSPWECPKPPASLVAVHVGNVFDHRLYSFSERSLVPFVDGKYLQQWNLLDKLPEWWSLAQERMGKSMSRHRILIVDDDEKLLRSFQRILSRHFDVRLAASGEVALGVIQEDGPFTAVISDYKMPGMNGLEFLDKAKGLDPDMVRIILSGYADLEMSLKAMNETDVFRLLTKPCDPKAMAKALKDALHYHEALGAQKQLMDETLKACIGILGDMLSMLKPDVYSRVMRIIPVVRELAMHMDVRNDWEIETGALLSMIGFVSLPEKLVEKICTGGKLSKQESEQYSGHPEFAAQIIGKIPRMDGVASIVSYQDKCFDGSGQPDDDVRGEDIPLGARILRVASDFDKYTKRGLAKGEALTAMLKTKGCYDPAVLDALTAYIGEEAQYCVRKLYLHALQPRMILAQDIISGKGSNTVKVLSKGQELTDMTIEFLIRFAKGHRIEEPLLVVEPLVCSLEDHS